jgi:hypothetical protein
MKAVIACVLLVHGVIAGEISDLYYKAAEERSDAAAKRREEAIKQIHKEPDAKKRIELLTTHPDLKTHLPPTGGFIVFTNNGVTEIAHVSTNHGVSEFGLERKGFAFTVTSDGRCRLTQYPTKPAAPPLVSGKPKQKAGIVSMVEFHRIAGFLAEIDFWNLEDDYDASANDFPTVFSTAVRNGRRKTIRDFAGAGPSRLWAFEQLVDAMITHVRWEAEK